MRCYLNQHRKDKALMLLTQHGIRFLLANKPALLILRNCIGLCFPIVSKDTLIVIG